PRKPMGRECPPSPENPAHQPYPPGDGEKCEKLPETTPPTLEPPKPCPDPDPCCNCPTTPGTTPTCFESLIAKQAADILKGTNADAFKKELDALFKAAKDASTKYTRDTYVKLLAEWQRQDAAIVELIRKLVCAVPCWDCILECYVCPLL